jgi:trans-aconitate methyltransferase
MTLRDLSRGLTFDDAASSYDRYRPRYPSALFDDLAQVKDLSEDSRILEVGCGPGVATEEMMARGWSVLAVDPGAQLAKIAREKFDDGHFAVEVSTFDDWESRGRHFDVVFSAAAYHWVAPTLRWVKAADVLDEGGIIALVANKAMAQGSFHDFAVATQVLRSLHGDVDEHESPSLAALATLVETTGHDIGALWEAISPQGTEVVAGDLFDAADVRLYPWTTYYSTGEALGLLATYSRYLALDPVKRSALFERLAMIIDQEYGGGLTRHYTSILAMARRADRPGAL